MDSHGSRRKGNKGHNSSSSSNELTATARAPAGYNEHLLLLEERNRLLKRLRKKNRRQIENEKKEDGFVLYVNGANQKKKAVRTASSKSPPTHDDRERVRRTKTADGPRKKIITLQDLSDINEERKLIEEERLRARTAPARDRRKNWQISSVDIQTKEGSKRKVHAPEVLTGNYEDDFEDDSDAFDSSGSDDSRKQVAQRMSDMFDSEDTDSEVEDSSKLHRKRQSSQTNQKKHLKNYSKKYDGDDSDEEISEQLLLSITDVKKLRMSLEMNSSIKESLARNLSSDSDSDHEPTIPEEDEEIEEMLINAIDSVNLDDKGRQPKMNPLKMGDTIVLELASPKKSKPNLSLARKKDAENLDFRKKTDSYNNQSEKNKSKQLRPQSETNIHQGADKLKKNRPLSANRKVEDSSDWTADKLSLAEAMKAENESIKATKKQIKPSPLPSEKAFARRSHELIPKSKDRGDDSFRVLTPTRESYTSQSSQMSAGRMEDIMSKILIMAPRQQKRLMKMLGKIEESVGEPVSGTKMPDTSPKKPRNSFSKSDTVEVNIEVLSNWGNKERVGLTEIQFYDQNEKLVPNSFIETELLGARECSCHVDVLYNGKTKTNKEKNMWYCRYNPNVPVELGMTVHNPSPGNNFHISKLRLWNYNKSLTDLDVGARHIRVFLGGDQMYDGHLEKGCGNQVFDYSQIVDLRNENTTDSQLHESPHEINSSENRDRNGSCSTLPVRSPLSSPLVKPILPSVITSQPETSCPSTKLSPVASSYRSQTRTLNYSTDEQLQRPTVNSDRSSPEADDNMKDVPKMPTKQKGVKTPRKSKRMAAKLDGHSSTEVDNSKSISDSVDQRPVPSSRKLPDKSNKKSDEVSSSTARDRRRSLNRSSEVTSSTSQQRAEVPRLTERDSMTIEGGWGGEPVQVDQSISQSQDDTPMLQKLKEINKKESRRHKEVPTWLKQDDLSGRFESPPASRGRSRQEEPLKEEEVNMLVEEELSSWPQTGKDRLQTVFDDNKRTVTPDISQSEVDEELDEVTPMQKIQSNRSKWRDGHGGNLEESWGSLSKFNQSHRGRLSLDMDDDALDEYINPPKKSAQSEATIPESEDVPVDDDNFVIPELPVGKNLVINIKSSWGDRHYVGLTGVEIFSSTGEQVTVSKISADPPDINILPEYDKDPRVVTNLIDKVNRTRDDVHMWLAPLSASGNHFIYMTFNKPCKIAMMRIWNYNKSRIHSYRGAKDVIITLDGAIIFKGEIARACGGIEGGTEAFGDTILFTMDENILEAVSIHDDDYDGDSLFDEELDDVPFERPRTADDGGDERPFTRACGNINKTNSSKPVSPRPPTGLVQCEGNIFVFKGKKLELNFIATWGDLHYLGLTGLEVVGKDGESLPVTLDMVTATPRDVRSLPGHQEDSRTLNKLFNNTNVTSSDEHMWLIPFTEGKKHTLTINFKEVALLAGLRIWNYNKSPEDTYRGARLVHVSVDGKQISPEEGYLIRKGPGNCHFDFAQEIGFMSQKSPTPTRTTSDKISVSGRSSMTEEASQDYEAMLMPCGFIYQLQLFSTYGDPYYVGLNGLEIFDEAFNQITLTESNISAYPDSVNVLEGVKNDVRTPDKLVDGENDSTDGRHMWLAPILPSILNRVYVIFDQPTTISMIKIWNYSKNPQRGVKDFAVLVDDLLVYNGTLQSVTTGARGILPTCEGPQHYHTILFTENKEILRREKHTVISNQAGGQDVQLTNDKMVVTQYSDPKKAKTPKVNQSLRPMTSVTGRGKKYR
ncbi:hypothetical protein ScPMuIL_004516 [Solemya velum]